MRRFEWVDDGSLEVRLDIADKAVLAMVPKLVGDVGELGEDPAAARLRPAVHRDDAKRSNEFNELAETLIDDARTADLDVVLKTLSRQTNPMTLSEGEALAWIRALTTARLILGARLGIEEDGWESNRSINPASPQVVALHLLGRLQDSLVAALSDGL